MANRGEKPRCSKIVSRDIWSLGSKCMRYGVVVREGKPYCKQHDPEAVRARDEARRAKWAERGRSAEASRREACQRAAALGGKPHYYSPPSGSSLGNYTGGLVLTPEECDALIARLEAK